jgi:hypothetical protein
MKHFPSFVTAYGEVLAASSSAARGVVNAAANINHCYASVKLWLLLERMLSQSPETADARVPIPKAMPFVIWNELWTPFSDLISAYEMDVSKGQDTVRAASHIPQTACLTGEPDAMECYVVCHRGPFSIFERVLFSFSVRDRGARGHPQPTAYVRSTGRLQQGKSSEIFLSVLFLFITRTMCSWHELYGRFANQRRRFRGLYSSTKSREILSQRRS